MRIELDVTDDFGQPGHRTLVLEAMGRRSNLILLDGENRVIDCLRRVDAEMSASPAGAAGAVLRASRLHRTAALFTEETEEGLAEKLAASQSGDRQLDRFLLDSLLRNLAPDGPGTRPSGPAGETDGRLLQSGRGPEESAVAGRFLCICKAA